jgi:YD repeat-containing protein
VTESRYDPVGNRTAVIDANGQVTKYLYDERDSLAEVDQSPNPWTDPNATPSPKYATTYAYDHLGNLERVVRAQGTSDERRTDYAYDGLNRVRTETQYPNWPATTGSLVTSTTYDLSGNRRTVVDPLNRTTTLTHDGLNRLTEVNYSDPGTPDVVFDYDANNNRATMDDGTGTPATTTYQYDELDRLTSVTSPGPRTVGYRYDLDGNRTKLVYPDNTAVTYTFDHAGRLGRSATGRTAKRPTATSPTPGSRPRPTTTGRAPASPTTTPGG